MAKGNGGTRKGNPISPKGLNTLNINTTSISDSRSIYNSFDENIWQKTLFNEVTGGYVVTERSRIPKDDANQNIKDVFQKEQAMCEDLAGFGLGVKHLYEKSGTASPDIEIQHGAHSIVEINGKRADLKELNNANNIRKESKDTFEKKKKADLIVFKFKTHDGKIPHEIEKLRAKGWHGIYYYEGEKQRYDF